MPDPDRTAAYKLIHDATLVQFEVVEKHIEPSSSMTRIVSHPLAIRPFRMTPFSSRFRQISVP